MDASTQLFIRACKTKNPLKRVERVYKKFYLYQSQPVDKHHIVNILLDICQKGDVLTVRTMVNALDPDQFGYYGLSDGDTFIEKVFKILVSKIRLCRVSKFGGFISPIKFRRED
jgi:hypothetical protein